MRFAYEKLRERRPSARTDKDYDRCVTAARIILTNGDEEAGALADAAWTCADWYDTREPPRLLFSKYALALRVLLRADAGDYGTPLCMCGRALLVHGHSEDRGYVWDCEKAHLVDTFDEDGLPDGTEYAIPVVLSGHYATFPPPLWEQASALKRLHERYVFLCESSDSLDLFIDASEERWWTGVEHARLLAIRAAFSADGEVIRSAGDDWRKVLDAYYDDYVTEVNAIMREIGGWP